MLYVLGDFVIGPTLVGAGFLGFALFIGGVAAVWHFGVPWLLAMAAVGLAWVAIALETRRVVVWELHFAR
jgi:Na+/pantothenate symporter